MTVLTKEELGLAVSVRTPPVAATDTRDPADPIERVLKLDRRLARLRRALGGTLSISVDAHRAPGGWRIAVAIYPWSPAAARSVRAAIAPDEVEVDAAPPPPTPMRNDHHVLTLPR